MEPKLLVMLQKKAWGLLAQLRDLFQMDKGYLLHLRCNYD